MGVEEPIPGGMNTEGMVRMGDTVLRPTFIPPVDAAWRPYALDPGGRDLVLHGDLGTWNLVVDGDRITILDWDERLPTWLRLLSP